MRRTGFIGLVGAMLLLSAVSAFAQTSKLDPHVRAAIAGLQSGASVQSLRASQLGVSDAGDLDVFIRGNISRAELEAMGVRVRTEVPGGIFTAYVPLSAIDQVAASAAVTSVRGAVMCQQYLDVSIPISGINVERGAGPAFTGINGAGVLVGDVDSGIDIHHDDFKDAGGLSRILYCWDQNNTTSIVPPAGYSYGHEWLKSDIDGGLCTEVDGGTLAGGGGHGSHCMGIAAGDGSAGTTPYLYAGVAPKADIAMVATTFYDTGILDGVAYIFQQATNTGKNAVVNLSLGSQYGPHDGSSDFEAGLDAMSGPGRVICVAAGNDRASSAATFLHGGMDTPAAGDSMKFTISGGTTNGRFVEFNGWYSNGDAQTITLRSPGNLMITLAPGASYGVLSGSTGLPTNVTGVNGNVYCENALYTSAGGAGAHEYYLIMEATGTGVKGLNGVWTVYVNPTTMTGPTSRFDMWKDYVSTTSLSAYFSLKNTNDHLTSEPSNARNVICVAAYETKNSWVSCNAGGTYSYTGPAALGDICTFSSPGPSRDGFQKPDIAAPGMGIASVKSADATGTCAAYPYQLNDGAFHMIDQGTSMATPHVTGSTALLFQKFGALTPAQVKTYLNGHAIVDSHTGTPWNNSFGNGKLFLADLVNPTAAVVSPNGGEILYISSTVNLTWTASDNVGVTNVDLTLSRDGGTTWETVATGVANSGTYPWTVTGPQTSNALLHVTAHDAAGNNGNGQSAAVFSISLDATPTLVSEFVASTIADGIQLRWQVAEPGMFSNVTISRAPSAVGPWTQLSAVPTHDGNAFVVVDNGVTMGETYSYRLQGTTSRGVVTTLGQISATAGAAITQFAVTHVAPNPSKGFVNVEFTVPRAANVKVSIMDVQGRTVATLADGVHSAGRYQATWSGDLNGSKAPSGLYFVRMQAPGVTSTRRVAITR